MRNSKIVGDRGSNLPTRLLRIPDVADRLGTSARTVWTLISLGKLATVHLTKRATRIAEAELDRYLISIGAPASTPTARSA